MHRKFNRPFILLIMFLSARMLYAWQTTPALSDSLPFYHLDPVSVWGERIAPPSAQILDIKREDMASLDAQNVQQALGFTAGLVFSRSSKNEMTFRLRGFEQRQVSVFVDGVPVSVPYDGVVDLAQFSGGHLETIRIAKGATPAQFGANTLGGSINVITRVPQSGSGVSLRLEGSDHSRLFGSAELYGGIGPARIVSTFDLDRASDFRLSGDASGMQHEDGGRRENSAYRKASGSIKVHIPLSQMHNVGFHVRRIDNRFNVPTNARRERPRYWRFPEWKKWVFSASSDHAFGGRFMLRTRWFYDAYQNRLDSYDDATFTTQDRKYAFSSLYDDHSIGSILYPTARLFSFGETAGVVSVKRDVHKQKDDDESVFSEFAIETVSAGVQQTVNVSKSLYANLGLDGSLLRPLKAAENPLRESIVLINGQVFIRHQLAKSVALHVSTGRKTRFPTLKELYSERLGRSVANPDLREERSFNSELGMQWQGRAVSIQMAGFYDQLRDLIVSRPVGDGANQMQNIGKAVFWGGEVDARMRGARWTVSANYTYLSAENHSEDRDSDHLEYRPRHRLNILAQIRVLPRWTLGCEWSATTGQYYQNADTEVWEKLNRFNLLNLRSELRLIRGVQWYIRANNVFDVFYDSEYGVPMPGRELVSGVKIGLKD